MSQTAKRKRTRKPTKEKDGSSRQTSLWDAFGLKSSSKKNTPSASAATSENESIPADDIIDICSSDAEPIPDDSSAPPASSSPYPIAGSSSGRAEDEVPLDGSKDVPIIIIDSSPVRSPARPRKALPQHPPKPLYSIFAPRKRPDERSSSQPPTTRSSTAPLVPLPDSSMQHVRGPQSVFSVSSSISLPRPPRAGTLKPPEALDYSRLNPKLANDAVHDPIPPPARHSIPMDATARERCLVDIPATHRRYPALSRLLVEPTRSAEETPDESASSHLLWTDKWRPRRADQVLGNERSALYLRDWLLATKLHIASSSDTPVKGKRKTGKTRGTKRPRLVRQLQRKRSRLESEEPEEPWLAEESTDEELPLDVILESDGDLVPTELSRLRRIEADGVMDEVEPPSSPPAPSQDTTEDASSQPSDTAPAFSYKPPKFGDQVFNTILLSGPNGCGKTAAVYACAEELGWDVFEVYPGIGERSGAALNKLIGDVGKNHLVTQAQQQASSEVPKEKPARPKANFFVKRVVSDDEAEDQPAPEIAPEPKAAEDAKPEAMSVVSQSIILVEEVDVLYKEDANFWPALLKIISECRRPVVLTCNDTSLVSFDGLPLQTTLQFTPCPPPLATSYLQALCLAEGRFSDRAAVARLYEHPEIAIEEQHADLALHPDHIPQPTQDLRRAINQLQLGGALSGESEVQLPSEDQSIERLKRMKRCIELASFVDGELRRPGVEVLRDLLANSVSSSADEQLGFRPLVAEPSDMESHLPVAFSTYTWDETLVDDLLSSAQLAHPAPTELLDPTPRLHPLHATLCGALLPVLDALHVPRALLVRDAHAVFVDYTPWVRHMSRVDEARIAETVASGRLEGTRRTRNSQRSQWELGRWIGLGEEGLDILRRTAFEVDVPEPEVDIL